MKPSAASRLPNEAATLSRRLGQRGFTLLEVMVAVAILGMVLVSLIGLKNRSMQDVMLADHITTATLLATRKMNETLVTTGTGTIAERGRGGVPGGRVQGLYVETIDLTAAANLTLAMLDEGTATRTSQQIGDELALLGAQISAGSSLDASFVTLNALKDRHDPSLALYADVILNPSFPQGDLDRLRQQVLAQIKQELVQPTGLALRTLTQLLYGPGHPYAMPLTGSGTEAAVQAMTRADLQRFHRTWFRPNRATFLVFGDITRAELKPKLARAFASWQPGEVPGNTLAALPGGLGLADISLAGIYVQLGGHTAALTAAAAALAYRLIAFWLLRLVGFVSWQVLEAKS